MQRQLKLIFLLLAFCATLRGQSSVIGCLASCVAGSSSIGAVITQSSNDLYCPASGSPTWGSADGPAQLPTDCYKTAIAGTPAAGPIVNVATAGQLTTALAAAACDQIITLQAGMVFSGNFTLPAVSCTEGHYLWIQSSAVSSLPAEAARYTVSYNSLTLYAPLFGPCYAGVSSLPGRPTFNCPAIPGTYTAQIVTPNLNPALTFTAGTSRVRIIGIEFTRTTGTGLVNDLVLVGDVGNVDHVILDRCWFHGTELGDETNRAWRFNAVSYVASIDSYYSDFYCVSSAGSCTDSKTIGGGTNTTNSTTETTIKIVNNYLEASGENLLSGGGSGNTVPSNIEIRLNLVFKPLVWNPSDPSYNGGYKGGHPVVVKNLFELKNQQLTLLEGNQFINTWAGFSQNGQALTITPANQNTNLCPVCEDVNITIRYNRVSSANSLGLFSINPNLSNSVPAGGNHWSIHDIVADNLLYPTCNSCPTSASTFQIVTQPSNVTTAAQTEHDTSITHNTVVYAATAANTNAMGVSGPLPATGAEVFNITFTNNVFRGGGGIGVSVGGVSDCANGFSQAAIITNCWNPFTFGGNCIVANGTHTWPGTNVTSVASYAAVFANYNNGLGGDYTIASGACKAAASDGKDPGANLATLQSVLNGSAVH